MNQATHKSKKSIAHESGVYHVTGEAIYIEDMLMTDQMLHGHVVYSKLAHAKIKSYSLDAALRVEGVHAILTHKDLPTENQMGPIVPDELVLAEDKVTFIGQAIFLIAADNEEAAIKAERVIDIEFEELEPITTIEAAIKANNRLAPQRIIERGDVSKLKDSKHVIKDQLIVGGQEHWYLETQCALAIPGEGKELKVYSSTQHPSETQALIAEVLDIPKNEIEVLIRRMGGAFGGKETQANHTAIWTSLLAVKTQQPVKIKLFRDDDQIMTGKRHRYLIDYEVGFSDDGMLEAIDIDLHTDAGSSTDLTMAVLERAMMHADNAYYVPNIKILGNAWKTNLPSNTAYRGFGGPQGVAVIETIVDRIARFLKVDATVIRKKNFYQDKKNNTTPYKQLVENNRLERIYSELMESSEYDKRRKVINDFNKKNEYVKRGMALTPIKFGISFTTSFLNQAGALVHIYKDGSLLVNHGGTEMGQGLHTKIKIIAAKEMGVNVERVKVNATNTSKVPNTSATAASAGTDLNGMAVKNAVEKIKRRISNVIVNHFKEKYGGQMSIAADLKFKEDKIFDSKHPDRIISFNDAVMKTYLNQVSLSATGFYRTPDVHFDREKGEGKPYHYFAFGMAVAEVEVDILTGFYSNIRADILHDVGESINERLDIGQVEGGYIQGMGWCTTEECKWNEKGQLLNHSPDTYKIPGVQDVPKVFNVNLLQDAPNPNTIRRSKAVAEPPFMLCFAPWLAIKDAISAVADHELEPQCSIPMTNEAILLSIENLKQRKKKNV